jgi:tRNA A37 N6-isopentenylltransferase MiaA
MLEGTLQAADLAEAISAATRQYAKRQETWLRHQLRGPVESFDASGAPEALANEVLARYRAAAT